MIITKNITLCHLEIDGVYKTVTIAKKAGAWCAYTDGGALLFKSDTYKGLIAILSEYENLNK